METGSRTLGAVRRRDRSLLAVRQMRIVVEGSEREHAAQLAALLHSLLQLSNIPVELRAPPLDGVLACAKLLRLTTNEPVKVEVRQPKGERQ